MEIKTLAFYLPQYHPIRENDEWWGKGFTEWTNVVKAKPLYNGHKQPLLAGELGYYDLRVPEVRERQAELAKEYGLSGFIYYHYWFGEEKKLLERIAEEVLESGKPDIPFCFCWANETWSGIWHGLDNKVLAEQCYPGQEDIRKHMEYLLPFFKDYRYIKIDGMPLFMIYEPLKIPNSKEYLDFYRELAKAAGFKDLYIVASSKGADDIKYGALGYDAKVSNAFHVSFDEQKRIWNDKPAIGERFKRKMITTFSNKNYHRGPAKLSADKVFDNVVLKDTDVETYPMVLPNWDNTPRSGTRGIVIEDTNANLFQREVKKAVDFLNNKSDYKEKILVVKSWNEWAEGNILEPDSRNGYSYLEVLKSFFG